jgi:hypothetical protein
MARLPPASAIWFAILCRKTITTAAINTTVPNTPAVFVLVHAMGFNADFMWRFFVRKANKRFPFWKGALQRDRLLREPLRALE